MAVPLVVHFPQRFRPASRSEAVSLVDLTPTLLALAGQKIPGDLDGVSLLPLLEGAPALPARALYLESQRPWRSYGWAALRAVVEGPWKLIAAPRPELYHLERDPKELQNLVDEERVEARRLAGVLRTFETTAGASGSSLEDSETQARLEALGYVGGGAGSGSEFQGADPKDRIHLWNRLHEAETALQARRFPEAAAAFEEVLKEDPKNRFALSRAGIAHLETGKPAQAEIRLRQALAIDGDHAVSRQALALALVRQEKWNEAREQWQELLRVQPRNVDAWVQLSLAEQKLGRSAEAKQALDRAQKLRSQQPHSP
jgi:tetratricopeptide (TPR) repeat protein